VAGEDSGPEDRPTEELLVPSVARA
jgi:hypothetical protein